MQIAKFKKGGGTITVEIRGGYAQPGSYSLFLWEANVNKIVLEAKGNFINTDDDKYSLPVPNEANNGRIIDVGITFVLTPPINNYYGEVIVSQDGIVIGKDFQGGSSTDQTLSLKLLVKLEQEV